MGGSIDPESLLPEELRRFEITENAQLRILAMVPTEFEGPLELSSMEFVGPHDPDTTSDAEICRHDDDVGLFFYEYLLLPSTAGTSLLLIPDDFGAHRPGAIEKFARDDPTTPRERDP